MVLGKWLLSDLNHGPWEPQASWLEQDRGCPQMTNDETGGSLGWKTKGALMPEFEKVAFELEASSTASPKWAEAKTSEGTYSALPRRRGRWLFAADTDLMDKDIISSWSRVENETLLMNAQCPGELIKACPYVG